MQIKTWKNFNESIYWGSRAAGILPYCSNTKRFMVGLRSDFVLEPNTYGLFGGKFDNNEDSAEMVALREFKEETNFDGKINLKLLYKFEDVNFVYYNFLGILEEEFIPDLNWENDEYLWLTYDELVRLDKKHFGLEKLMKYIPKNI